MTMQTKIRKIGNSYGIVLPKEAMQAMKVKEGDVLYVTEAPANAIQLTPDKKDFGEKMRIADDLMRRYRNALRELAK